MKNELLSVIVWNEFIHERQDPAIWSIYPDGLHCAIAKALKRTPGLRDGAASLDVTTATLDQPDHGLSEARLDACDVLIWWGHLAHDDVADEVVNRIQRRVLEGMGIIVLHSGYSSKIFRRLLGTSCPLKQAPRDEQERLWVVQPSHPIAAGLGELFELPVEAMYGESFDLSQPDTTVFISRFAGGEVFSSGCCWERGYGRLFYFRPGHIDYPTFHDANVQRVLANAVQWAAPRFRFTDSESSAHGAGFAEDTGLHHNAHRHEDRQTSLPPGATSKPFAGARTRHVKARKTAHTHWPIDPPPLFPTLIRHLEQSETKPKRH